MTLEEIKWLQSQKWRRFRKKILARDGYMCQYLKRYGRTEPGNIVHHIFPRSEFPEYATCDWNCITVSALGHKRLEDINGLTEEGRKWLVRTARKQGIQVPEKYKNPIEASPPRYGPKR